MSNYIARVELHSADSEDYETLHGEMKEAILEESRVAMGSLTICQPEHMWLGIRT
jgi:hypothetical protein